MSLSRFLIALASHIDALSRKIVFPLRQWGFGLEKKKAIAAYKKVTFRIAPEGGRYRNNAGEVLTLVPNETGWLDGLAFVIVDEKGRNRYTVCERGYVWPKWPKPNDRFNVVEKVE